MVSHILLLLRRKETLKMNLWLVGLGLALFCTINAESECSGDHSKLQGKWYVTAEASNSEFHLRQKDKMKILPSELSITEDNKLKIISTVPKRIGCKKMGMEYEKLENGTYFQTFGCERKLEIVSTDCETYAMVAVKIEKKEKDINHLWMYTRKPKLTPELKEKFLEHGRSMEFLCGQMIFPHEVACQEETKTVSDACSPEDANSNL